MKKIKKSFLDKLLFLYLEIMKKDKTDIKTIIKDGIWEDSSKNPLKTNSFVVLKFKISLKLIKISGKINLNGSSIKSI